MCHGAAGSKGKMLGSISFGAMDERVAENGIFFCHKRGSFIRSERIGMQATSQLEQEIALLREIQHVNIVQCL